MPDLPSGTVTFLFTDIEGSTERWERDHQSMAAAVEDYIALLDAAIQDHGGIHFKTVGDAGQAAFPTAPAAVAASRDTQRALKTGGDRPTPSALGAACGGSAPLTTGTTIWPPRSIGSRSASRPAWVACGP
jgi:class 3 adenylate cyclase